MPDKELELQWTKEQKKYIAELKAQIEKMKNFSGEKWQHKKTGNIYIVINKAIECTNGREDIEYIVYSNGEKTFVRQAEEFYTKFEKLKN